MQEKSIGIAEKIMVYSLYSLVIFLPVSKAALNSIFVIILLGFLLKRTRYWKFELTKDISYLFLFSFLFFSALSIINSGTYLIRSIRFFFTDWLAYFLIFIVAADSLRDKIKIRKFIYIFLGAAFIIVIDAFFQLFTGVDLIRQRPTIRTSEFNALTASFGYYNSLGAYLVPVLSLIIALCIFEQIKTKKIILFSFMILSVICLGLTFSRGAWVGFIISLLLMVILLGNLRMLFTTIFILLILFMLPIPIKDRFLFTFQVRGDMARFNFWSIAWQMIKEHPFLGKGIGTFKLNFPAYQPGWGEVYVHNCFLQIWVESGVFAILSFLGFIFSFLWKGIRTFKETKDSILLGLICGISGFLVHSFFDVHLYTVHLAVLFWVLMGALAAITNEGEIR